MPTLTANFSFQKPLVNNATDADLWGGQLNTNWDDLDTDLALTTSVKTIDFNVASSEFNYTYLVDSSAGAVTATLPSTIPFSGFVVRFKFTDITNTITIDGDGNTLDGAATLIASAVDDVIEIISDGTNWVLSSLPAATQAEADAGAATNKYITPATMFGATEIIQETLVSDNTEQTITTAIPADTTTPQNTEGGEVFSQSFTPKVATSKVVISGYISAYQSNAWPTVACLFVDSDVSAVQVSISGGGASGLGHGIPFCFIVDATDITARTYKIRVGQQSNTLYINRTNVSNIYGAGIVVSSLSIKEVRQ